jgi:hypothetical protein
VNMAEPSSSHDRALGAGDDEMNLNPIFDGNVFRLAYVNQH